MENQPEGLKEAIELAPGADQPETPVEETEPEAEAPTEAESIESLPGWAQDRLKKTEEERDNYKQGLLSAKKKTLTPPKEETETEEEIYPDWDENSKKFQKQTVSQAETVAERKAREIVENYTEKAAINQFIAQNPELEDDAKWQEVVANYVPKHGKESPDNVLKDLKRAYVLTRYEKGELNQMETEAFKKGETKGAAKVKLAEAGTVSKSTSKSALEGKDLSPGALKLAQKLRVNPQDLAQEDDSLRAEIKF